VLTLCKTNNAGNLIINELESIDANFVPSFYVRSNELRFNELRVRSFISEFWREKLLLSECIVAALKDSRVKQEADT